MEGISINNDDHEEEEEEDWDIGFSSTCSKQTLPHPPSEIHNEVEETEEDYNDDEDDYVDDDDGDEDDDKHELELGCPYCTENLDILGLCCHIDDQHYKEVNSGICPICTKRLETSMTVHIIGQHENFLRALCREKLRGGVTSINLSQLKKEEHSRSHLETSSRVDASYDLSPDLLLLSFVQNSKPLHRRESLRALSPTSNDHVVERSSEVSNVTYKVQDKAQVCDFIKGIVFSTIFDDGS